MKTATVTEFRSKMKEHLQEIEDDQDILILSGPKKKNFVVLTLDEYNAMEETAYLMSNANNSSRLLESIAEDKAGKSKIRKIDLDLKSSSSKAKAIKKKK
jgi:antitoxin YefM